jgi:hypothetical protein
VKCDGKEKEKTPLAANFIQLMLFINIKNLTSFY